MWCSMSLQEPTRPTASSTQQPQSSWRHPAPTVGSCNRATGSFCLLPAWTACCALHAHLALHVAAIPKSYTRFSVAPPYLTGVCCVPHAAVFPACPTETYRVTYVSSNTTGLPTSFSLNLTAEVRTAGGCREADTATSNLNNGYGVPPLNLEALPVAPFCGGSTPSLNFTFNLSSPEVGPVSLTTSTSVKGVLPAVAPNCATCAFTPTSTSLNGKSHPQKAGGSTQQLRVGCRRQHSTSGSASVTLDACAAAGGCGAPTSTNDI